MSKNKLEQTVKVGSGDEAKDVDIYVLKPSNSILKDSDRHKSKAWNEAVQDGVLTKKELGLLMTKRGIWDEARDKKAKKITDNIIALEKELFHGKKGHRKPKLSEGRELAIKIRLERIAHRTLIAEKIALEENSADSIADNAKFDYIVAYCSYYADGTRVYKDFDDYDNKAADEVAFAAAALLGRMLYSLDQDFEKNLPENEFLVKFSLVDDDLHLIDPNNPEHLIDTDGRRIDNDGYYLNDDGERTDRDGNRLTEEGKYEMTDYENDLVVKKKAKKVTPKTNKAEASA